MNSAQSAVATPDINTSWVLFSLVIRVFTTPSASFSSPSGYRSSNGHEPQVRSSTVFNSDKQFQFIVTSGASYNQPYLDCLVSYCITGTIDEDNYNSLLDS